MLSGSESRSSSPRSTTTTSTRFAGSVDSRVKNLRDWGIPLGRRFRALKLWFVMRYFGRDGIERVLRAHIAMAQRLAKLVDNEVKVIDNLDFTAPKSAEFKAILDAVKVDRTCLVAIDGSNRNVALSARNLENVSTIRIEQLNAFELLNHRYLVVDRASLEAFLDGSAWAKTEKEAA